MSSKNTKTIKPQSPRAKKKKCVKNTYDLVQFKKMIGKDLVIPYKTANFQIDPAVQAAIKEKIISGSIKTIGMSGFVSSGIVHVFDGIDRLIAVHSVSYAEIKKAKLEIEVFVNQYFNMTQLDLL